MKVLIAFDPSDEDKPLIEKVWPKEIQPVILPKDSIIEFEKEYQKQKNIKREQKLKRIFI